ncbi:MAG: ImmA/IrrE family metallo-endopeptidase [Firmicutes bacterium]|nr:ImmA/IrrE family metallo-endopeptidase [Bacillota bacterium]
MAVRAYINKNTLQALRGLKKVSFAYIEKTTTFTQAIITKWEDVSQVDEKSYPTIVQAKKLAECYRVPFAAFFLEHDKLPQSNLPNMVNKRILLYGVSEDESSVNLAIYDLLNKRDLFIETSKELGNEIEPFVMPTIAGDDVVAWGQALRSYFELNLSEQYRLSSKRQFYLYLRNKVERKGIFVNCFSGVRVEECRGFVIVDKVLPIIGINAEDRPPAKSFSIIHEVVHLFNNVSSFCNVFFDNAANDADEVFCNAVAGEVLVPSDALDVIIREQRYSVFNSETIKFIAERFCVSREVITRRLLNMGKIVQNEYDTLITLFATELKQEKEKAKASGDKGIPKNVPRETFDKISNQLCIALLHSFGEGLMTRYDVASYLAVKSRHIEKFLGEVYAWNR